MREIPYDRDGKPRRNNSQIINFVRAALSFWLIQEKRNNSTDHASYGGSCEDLFYVHTAFNK